MRLRAPSASEAERLVPLPPVLRARPLLLLRVLGDTRASDAVIRRAISSTALRMFASVAAVTAFVFHAKSSTALRVFAAEASPASAVAGAARAR